MINMYNLEDFDYMELIYEGCNNIGDLKEKLENGNFNERQKQDLLNFFPSYKIPSLWKLRRLNNSNDVLKIKNFKNVNDVISQIDKARKSGINFSKVLIFLENKTYENLESLNQINEEIYLSYDNTLSSLEDFIVMRFTIDYYKSLIESYDLSPLEKITFAYDLIKSFPYHENKEDKADSRKIHLIVKNGNIVCVGYTKFLNQLLSELGIKTYTAHVVTNQGGHKHQRSLIKVDDDKYNIHEICAFDATLDSALNICKCVDKNGRILFRHDRNPIQEGDKMIREYDNTTLYQKFLIPLGNYRQIFSKDHIVKIEKTGFGDIRGDEIYNTINQGFQKELKNPLSFDQLVTLMYNVKLAEGFPIENIAEYINDIIEVNRFSRKNNVDRIESIIHNIKDNNQL